MSNKALIGSVVERKTPSWSNPPKSSVQSHSGFPFAQHRSKSAFTRNREKQRNYGVSRPRDVPNVVSAPVQLSSEQGLNSDNWRGQIGEENQRRVDAMTDEEREEEKRQIYERFGSEIGGILKRAKERAAAKKETASNLTIPVSIARGMCLCLLATVIFLPQGLSPTLKHANTMHRCLCSPRYKHKPST